MGLNFTDYQSLAEILLISDFRYTIETLILVAEILLISDFRYTIETLILASDMWEVRFPYSVF